MKLSGELQRANKALILQKIYENAPISRIGISVATGLNKATVSTIIHDFLETGLIRESGIIPAESGRRSMGLTLHMANFAAVVIRIKRSHLMSAVYDLSDDLRNLHRCRYQDSLHLAGILEQMEEEIRFQLEYCRERDIAVLGISIATLGSLFTRGGTHQLHVEGFQTLSDGDICREMQERFPQYHIIMEHDANASAVHCLEHQGIAQGIGIGQFRSVGLIEFRPAFAACPGGRACQNAQRTVTGGVYEDVAGKGETGFGTVLEAADGSDDAVLGFSRFQAGVQVQVQPFLPAYLFPHDGVPDGESMVRIAVLVFQQELQQDAGLHHVGLAVVTVGPDYVHSDLTAGVSADHAAVLDQRDAGAVAGSGDGGTHAGKPAADDNDLIVLLKLSDWLHGIPSVPYSSNNSIPSLVSSSCNARTSSCRGWQPRSAHIAAATPTACPIAMQIDITRYEACARCVPEMQRPAVNSPSIFFGTKQPYGRS